MDAAQWRELDRHERYRRQAIGAALASRSRPILSHYSAARMWGIPIIGQWPSVVHVLASRATGTRTENGFRRHAGDPGERRIVDVDGVRVTSVADTLLDLAATATFACAVTSVDHALRTRLTTTAELRSLLVERGIKHAPRRIQRVLDFATPLSGSPGESLSRVVIHELGFPPPELQMRFSDYRGHIGDVDFCWPRCRLIGEFDGLVKYTRDQYMRGRSIDQIVIAEKVREDRLRATGSSVSRWLWGTALHPKELYQQLTDAGLRTIR